MRISLLVVLGWALGGCGWAVAQSFAPHVLSSAGTEQSVQATRFSWTVGEAVVTTRQAQSTYFTEGFQQPFVSVLISRPEASAQVSQGSLVLFPVPARDEITLRGDFFQAGELHLSVYDVQGREVMRLPAYATTGYVQLPLNVESLSAAMYSLRVHFQPQRGAAFPVQFIKFTVAD